MKKLKLMIIILLVSFQWIPLKAQDSRIGIGLEGGPALTTFYGNTQAKKFFKPVLGGYTGILVQYDFTSHFSLKTGLTYERMGTHYQVNSQNAGGPVSYQGDFFTGLIMSQSLYC